MAPTRSSDSKGKKRRGRPPGSKKKPGAKPNAPSKKNSRPKRSSQIREQHMESRPPTPEANYVQLAPRTRRIAQETIDTWPQISPQVLEQMVAVLGDAKKEIVNTQRDAQKTAAADDTLNGLVRLLGRQLSASRIPPQARDVHFNIDKLTERNAHVFREVTTARHSKQLLKEQVKVAEHFLKKDEEGVEQLKKNTKEWKSEWKHQHRNGRLHPLLQDSEAVEVVGDRPEDINLRRLAREELSWCDEPDADLAPVLEQLRRSVENMQGNHGQVEGIGEAATRAQAALDDVVFQQASAQQYDAL